MRFDFRQRLLGTTLLVGASMLATPALAQEAAADPAADQSAEPQAAAPEVADAPADADAPAIVVTGTRIPSANLESAAPVTVVSTQDLKLTGNTRVEDVLNSLPSVGASQNSNISNGATGTATVDLRRLSAKRTLVLVNGRRLTPGDPNSTSQAADVNFIPSSLIKRAEVLTGGASSVYGADAVAGVVNFIMDTSFTGIRFDGQYSFYQHNNGNPRVGTCFNAQAQAGCTAADEKQTMKSILAGRNYSAPSGSVADGGTFDGTVSLGVNFDDDRGHAVANFGYRNVNPVLQARRGYSACVVQNTARVVGGVALPRNVRCGGSATANPGNAFIYVTDSGSTFTTGAGLGPGTITPGTTNLYNFAPLNHFQRPDERYTAGVFADYEISPAIKPYLEFMFMDDHSLAQIAPSGDFGNTLTINCDNPLMSPAQRAVICASHNLITGYLGNFPLVDSSDGNGLGTAPIDFANTDPNSPGSTYQRAYFQLLRRNTEGGGRLADLTHTSYRGVLGSKGDLGSAWSYDAYYQYGRTNYSLVYKNEFSLARLTRALDVVSDTRPGPGFGLPVCRSVLDNSDPTCVPYDVFGAAPSAAAANYLNVFGVIQGRTSEQVAHLDFTGSLGEYGVKFPWADDGVGINVGAEYRKEKLVLNPDQSYQAGDLTGQGAPTLPVDGSFRVLDFFGESQLPVVQERGIYDLTLGAGYRRSYYQLSNGRKYDTDTYKLSFEFAPIKDVRFRAAYNRAVRAPNIQELFAPLYVGLDGAGDPCAGHAILATEYGCLAQGMSVGQSTAENPAGQYNGQLGGNVDLNPETATTKTLGVILQPASLLPGFALTVDYWNIRVKDAIQGYGADAILAACNAGATATFTPEVCDLVHRNAGGSIWLTPDGYVVDTPNNNGKTMTDGIDVNGSYSRRLGEFGNLSANFNGTYLLHYKVDNGLTPEYDCAGLYGPLCSGGGTLASASPMPTWRHKLRTTLNMKNGIGVSLQWRMVGKVKAETLSDNESLHGDQPTDPGLHIKAQHYFDLATTYTFGEHYSFRLGVNNLLDNDPPIVTSGNAGLAGSNLCVGGCNGNTYPGTWDALGRYIYAGVTLDF
jgi:outer membrane receptor protein involved in Fe transport